MQQGRSWRGAALVLALALAASCGDDDSGDAASFDDVVDLPDDATSLPEDADGLDEDVFEPVEIPDDIPLPDDHEVVEAIGNPSAGYTVIARSGMSVGDVADFYESELPAAGWESVERSDAAGADVVDVGARKPSEDDSIGIHITDQDGGSSMQIFTGGPPS